MVDIKTVKTLLLLEILNFYNCLKINFLKGEKYENKNLAKIFRKR